MTHRRSASESCRTRLRTWRRNYVSHAYLVGITDLGLASITPATTVLNRITQATSKRSIGRIFSLEEIETRFEVRDLFQAVEVKSLGFGFNSTAVKGMQAGYLGNIAMAIQNILEKRPHEIFFIEGHADAAGPEDYNLALSKQRALQVKSVLVNVFGLPERNIMAAGFGEKHLKVSTQRPEQANRRVTVRCITPLVHAAVTD